MRVLHDVVHHEPREHGSAPINAAQSYVRARDIIVGEIVCKLTAGSAHDLAALPYCAVDR